MFRLFRFCCAVFAIASLFTLTGCYIGIPAMVETVNQRKQLTASDGAVLESKTGTIKQITNSPENLSINCYITGYNHIMTGSSSLMPSYQILVNKTMRATERDAIPYPLISGLNQAITDFKSASSLTAEEITELDMIVQDAIHASEKLQIDQQNSLPYFRNQVYRKDGLRGGKVVLPAIKADYDRLIALMERMGDLLLEKQKRDTENRMQHFTDAGNNLGLYIEQSFLDAQELIAHLRQHDAYQNRNSYQYADVIVEELTFSLERMKSELERSNGQLNSEKDLLNIHDKLAEMIAYYQKLKQDRRPAAYNRMMKRYSDAVIKYNASSEIRD